MEKQFFSAKSFEFANVDKTKNELSNVSIIMEGEAKGYGVLVDKRSLQGGFELLKGKRLKAYVTHNGSWKDRTGEEVGYYENFKLSENKILADFTPFKSLSGINKQRLALIYEMASEMPNDFGVSITLEGSLAWAAGDEDVEYDPDGDKPENASFEMPSIRFSKIKSADFVDNPAANDDGLFRAKLDELNSNKMSKELQEKNDELQTQLETAHSELKNSQTKAGDFEAKYNSEVELSKAQKKLIDDNAKIVADLKADKEGLEKQLADAQSEKSQLQAELKRETEQKDKYKSIIDGSEFLELDEEGDVKQVKLSNQQIIDKECYKLAKELGISERDAIFRLGKIRPELFNAK